MIVKVRSIVCFTFVVYPPLVGGIWYGYNTKYKYSKDTIFIDSADYSPDSIVRLPRKFYISPVRISTTSNYYVLDLESELELFGTFRHNKYGSLQLESPRLVQFDDTGLEEELKVIADVELITNIQIS